MVTMACFLAGETVHEVHLLKDVKAGHGNAVGPAVRAANERLALIDKMTHHTWRHYKSGNNKRTLKRGILVHVPEVRFNFSPFLYLIRLKLL